MSVDVETDGHVAVVTMSGEGANFVDAALLIELADRLDETAGSTNTRAVVFRTSGKHFCAGAALRGGGSHDGSTTADGTHIYDAALRVIAQPLPIVAVVQGAAVGAGVGLALTADFRIATRNARFVTNFARLGFHQGFGISALLPRLVGQQAAFDMLVTGRSVDAAEAKALGLCDQLVHDADVALASAMEVATAIAASAPLAVRAIRQTMRSGVVDEVRTALVRERDEQQRLMQTADFAEGVRAAQERRTPEFVGR